MKILVLNCGSSSVKSQLIETNPELMAADSDRQLARVSVERIGSAESVVHCEAPGKPVVKFASQVAGHRQAVETAVRVLQEQLSGVLNKLEEIEGVGHRIVHGGERFTRSVIMSDSVVRQIEASSELAPLHNPENLKGYYAARAILPHARHVAVFDTSFHQTIPPHAYMYGLPYSLYSRYRIRRYGFHGTSHRYVV
jgi:acetate kinase